MLFVLFRCSIFISLCLMMAIPAHAINLTRDAYALFQGDVDGDGDLDLLFKTEVRMMMLDFGDDVIMPIITSQPNFMLTLNDHGTYDVSRSPAKSIVNSTVWQPSSYNIMSLDLNNDGMMDAVYQGATSLAPSFVVLGDTTRNVHIAYYLTLENLGTYAASAHADMQLQDVNEDSVYDVVFVVNDVIRGYIAVGDHPTITPMIETTTTDVASPILQVSALDLSQYDLMIGDHNGDGLQDLYFSFNTNTPAASTPEYLLTRHGDTFVVTTIAEGSQPAGTWIAAIETYYTITEGDFNGDRLIDYFIGSVDPQGFSFFVLGNTTGLLSIHKYVTPLNAATDEDMVYSAADVNSDGFDDLIMRQKLQDQNNLSLLSIAYGTPHQVLTPEQADHIHSGQAPVDINSIVSNQPVFDEAFEEEIITGQEVGFIAGQHQVSPMGAFEYTIPITIPSGINGLQPQISARYSSQGSNGKLGVGFHLSDSSSIISRCGLNRIDDGDTDPVDYDDNDQYCLDGTRLVSTGHHTYRLKEGSGPLNIVFNHNNNTWKVYSRDGNVATYGEPDRNGTDHARVYQKTGLISSGHAQTPTFSWAITSVKDAFMSAMTFEYETDHVQGIQQLNTIAYNGYKIDFVYQDRPDTSAGVVAVQGPYLQNTQRLKHILIKNGTQVISDYAMSYGADYANRSLLKGITQCNGQGDCLPATLFEWDSTAVTRTAITNTNSPFKTHIWGGRSQASDNIGRYRLGDFNGDGRTDVYHIIGQNSTRLDQIYLAEHVDGEFTAINGKNTWLGVTNPGRDQWSYHIDRFIDGDFDGNGTTDIWYIGGNECSGWWEDWSNGTKHGQIGTFDNGQWIYYNGPQFCWQGDSNAGRVKIGDFDGNGTTDMRFIRNNRDLYWHFNTDRSMSVRQSSDDTYVYFGGSGAWFNNDLTRIRTADFNGDGKTDLFIQALAPHTQAESNIGTTDKNANHFTQQDVIIFAEGDGDISQNPVEPTFVYGMQYPFRQIDGMSSWHNATLDLARFSFIDINGDGKTDVYYQAGYDHNTAVRDRVFLGLGNGEFIEKQGIKTWIRAGLNEALTDLGRLKWIDFNHDGRLDIYIQTGDGAEETEDLVYLQLPNGNTLFSDTPIATGIYTRHLRDSNSTASVDQARIQFADFNGDGISDILKMTRVANGGGFTSTTPTTPTIYYSQGGQTKLTKITNGLGAWVKPTLTALHKTGYVTPTHNCDHPYVCHTPNIEVVTTLTVDNGLGDRESHNSNSIHYQYQGLRRHKDYGMLGFDTVIETSNTQSAVLTETSTNPTHDINQHTTVTTTKYSQDAANKMIGMILSTETKIDGVLINETINDLERITDNLNTGENPVSHVVRSATRAYDIAGEFLGITVKSQTPMPGKPRLVIAQEDCLIANESLWDATSATHCNNVSFSTGLVKKTSASSTFIASHTLTFADGASFATDSLVDTATTVITIAPNANASHARSQLTSTNRFIYTAGHALVAQEISRTGEMAANESQYQITKVNTYNAQGLSNTVTIDGDGGTDVAAIAAYTSSSTYNDRGLLTATTNGLGHVTMQYYEHPSYPWVVTRKTDPHGLTSLLQYDHMGRLERSISPLGTTTLSSQGWCQPNQACVYWKQTASTSSPASISYYDRLNRVIDTATEQAGNHGAIRTVHNTIVYDAYGHKISQRGPYETADLQFGSPITGESVNTYAGFDAVGRPIHVINGDSSRGRTYYLGHKTYYFNDEDWSNAIDQASTITEKNFLGQVTKVHDRMGGIIEYAYDVQGNLVQTTDQHGHQIKTYFDVLGHKIAMHDPDQGHWTYHYDLNGRLLSQTDTKGQTTTMTYDLLGRMISRTDLTGTANAETTQWIYGTHSLNPIGLHQIIGQGVVRTLDYDILQRVTSTTTEFEGETLISSTTFDELGRIETTHAPGGHLNLKHHYHPQLGHLMSVEDMNTNTPYWQLLETDVRGHITRAVLGNNVETTKNYDPKTGRLQDIRDTVGVHNITHMMYQFDTIGNLTSRTNVKKSRIELFGYDDLYRLTSSTMHHMHDTTHYMGLSSDTPLDETTLTYDSLGNIITKSDVGTYEYGVVTGRNCANDHAGPHAVTRISGLKNTYYCYDANGNMVSGDDRAITYTSFNKPTVIEQLKNGHLNRVTINYGPERSRIKRIDHRNGETTTTLYFGHLEIVNKNGLREWKYAIGDYAQKIYTTHNQSTRVNYFHRDHLGSLIAMTDENGTVLEEFSFDAWGKRRHQNWDGEISLHDFTPQLGWETHRGYTHHEHMDSVGLIHMNGRVYDPTIGRFLSADPHIQAPHNTQSFNRYSYVLNNPLSYTDPSGYLFKKLWKEVARHFKRNIQFVKKYWRPLLALAIGVMLPGAGFMIANFGVIGSGAITGFIAGAVSTGSLKGAIIGGLTGGMLGGIHQAFGEGIKWSTNAVAAAKKTLAHGLVGGINSKLSGGKFSHGFASMGATQAVSLSGVMDSGFFANGGVEDDVWRAKQAIGSGIIGGLSAVAAGGNSKDFAYGAVQGVMSRFLNDLAEHESGSKGCNNWSTNACLDDGKADFSKLEESANWVTSKADNAVDYWGAQDIPLVSPIMGTAAMTLTSQHIGNIADTALMLVPISTGFRFYKIGKEFRFGNNFRIAPFGNRTDHAIGKYPHYHRRVLDSSGQSLPGQGIKRHRPWESKSTDTTFGDRF